MKRKTKTKKTRRASATPRADFDIEAIKMEFRALRVCIEQARNKIKQITAVKPTDPVSRIDYDVMMHAIDDRLTALERVVFAKEVIE